MTDKLKNTSTSTVTAKLNSWFTVYGYPEYIRTDGGPQFRRDFKAYCDKYYIQGAAAYQLGNTSSRTITEVKQR